MVTIILHPLRMVWSLWQVHSLSFMEWVRLLLSGVHLPTRGQTVTRLPLLTPQKLHAINATVLLRRQLYLILGYPSVPS